MHGLRLAKVSGYAPLHVVGDGEMVLSQLKTHHSPQKAILVPLFWEARALAEDLEVSRWGLHYRAYNKMADRLANSALNTTDSIQVHASTGLFWKLRHSLTTMSSTGWKHHKRNN